MKREKGKGQQRIGLLMKQIYQLTADRFHLSARTVETYYRRHKAEANARWIAELSGGDTKAKIRAERDQLLRELSRRK